MSRCSYKVVDKMIKHWNLNHPEARLTLSVFDGYYHIGYWGPNGSITNCFIIQPGPSATVEAFEVWKNGYFKGLEIRK